MKSGKRRLPLVQPLLGCLLTMMGVVDRAAAQDGRVLPSVTVTGSSAAEVPTRSEAATKTDSPLIETPQSVSVVTRDQIDEQAATSIGQALRYTAGVVPEWRGLSSGKYDHIVVRGSAGYSADLFWDGLKVPSIGTIGGPNPDPYLLQRIEVLKGPSSVLYGQGTPNGLVHLVSKLPTADPWREVRLSAGSHDYRQVAFDFGGPIDADRTWLYRITGVGLDSGSQVDFVREKRVAIAPAITWRPSDRTTLTLLASHQHDPDLGYYDTRPVIGTAVSNPLGKVPTRFYAGEPGFDATDRRYTTVGYQFEHRFDDTWTVRQKLRHVDADYDWKTVAFQSLRADQRTANRYSSNLVRSGDGLQLDNQLQARFVTGRWQHTVLAGLDWQRENADSINYAGTAAPIDLYGPVYGGAVNLASAPRSNGNQVIRQTGLYLQDQMRWGDLVLLAGARRDNASVSSTNKLNGIDTSIDSDATTWRAGAVYLLPHGVAPYVSVARSFQPVSGFDATGNPFQPARGSQTEVGVKYQPGPRTFLTLAVYDLKEDNLTAPDDRNVGFSRQFGQVRTRGVELEGRMALTRALSLVAGYTLMDNEITRGAPAEVGKSRPNLPRHTASLWLDYRVADGALQGLGLGAGVRYIGASPANTANAPNYFEAPGYTLVDLAVHFELGRLAPTLKGARFDLNVKNLLDRDYVGSCGGPSVAGGYCWAGYRRTVLAALSYRW